ncbi:MAG: LacI family DNA-binding transcriptional regulator [Actinomycetaceae bacterium]|nr:LacI family DNA-binding transcriptional regulator [Actinomycetaceae bacterium]
MDRPTIRDIASVANVSPTAVSFVLNSKPGVSEATRERVLAVAKQMGWTPNAAARALSASKANAVGLVIARPETSLSSERFFFGLLVGIQARLKRDNMDLVLQISNNISEEIETYRTWWGQRRVDGVVVVDPRLDDPRPAALEDLGMPAVFVGEPVEGFSCVVGNDEGMITDIAKHLASQGAKRIGYLTGLASLVHTQRRQRALTRFGLQHGIDIIVSSETDYSEQSGISETNRLLDARRPLDAIIFDNEILALGGAQAINAHGLQIGKDILTASCEDSPICRVLTPPMTAAAREPALLGEHAAQLLLSVFDGEEPKIFAENVPKIIERPSSTRQRTGA